MSKMKHLLQKLHIGGGCNDNNNRLAAADTSSRPPATYSSFASQPISPIVDGTGFGLSSSVENVNDHSNASTVDSNFFEEEFPKHLGNFRRISCLPSGNEFGWEWKRELLMDVEKEEFRAYRELISSYLV